MRVWDGVRECKRVGLEIRDRLPVGVRECGLGLESVRRCSLGLECVNGCDLGLEAVCERGQDGSRESVTVRVERVRVDIRECERGRFWVRECERVWVGVRARYEKGRGGIIESVKDCGLGLQRVREVAGLGW